MSPPPYSKSDFVKDLHPENVSPYEFNGIDRISISFQNIIRPPED